VPDVTVVDEVSSFNQNAGTITVETLSPKQHTRTVSCAVVDR